MRLPLELPDQISLYAMVQVILIAKVNFTRGMEVVAILASAAVTEMERTAERLIKRSLDNARSYAALSRGRDSPAAASTDVDRRT
jgi:hypothetical protein